MKCPKCGKEIANDSQFCEYCGNKINPVKKTQKIYIFSGQILHIYKKLV